VVVLLAAGRERTRWRTQIFLAALRRDPFEASCVFDRAN
jgi:hypothetical protein